MITWGLVSASMMFVRSAADVLRPALSAGRRRSGILSRHHLLPDAVVSRATSARATIAAFMTAARRGRHRSAGRCRALLLSLDGVGGLAGWQWLFLLEGLPAIVLGFVVLARAARAAVGHAALAGLTPAERSALIGAARAKRAPGAPSSADVSAGRSRADASGCWRSCTSRFRSRSTRSGSGCRRSSRPRPAAATSRSALLTRDSVPRRRHRHGRRRPALGSHRRAAVAHRGRAPSVGGARVCGERRSCTASCRRWWRCRWRCSGLASMFGPFWTLATSLDRAASARRPASRSSTRSATSADSSGRTCSATFATRRTASAPGWSSSAPCSPRAACSCWL